MIAPESNDGKGLRQLWPMRCSITDSLVKSYCCPISNRAPPSRSVWWRQLPIGPVL